jgi:hypothetical protein
VEQGQTSEAQGSEQAVSRNFAQAIRLATLRECRLLETYIQHKYGHALRGRVVEQRVAEWSRQQLTASLKAG